MSADELTDSERFIAAHPERFSRLDAKGLSMSNDKLIPGSAVRARLGGVSRVTIDRWIEKGWLPKPVYIGQTRYWREEDIGRLEREGTPKNALKVRGSAASQIAKSRALASPDRALVASMALQGIAAGSPNLLPAAAAERAVKLADALIAELNK